MARFSTSEWRNINAELERESASKQPYGMPARRTKSVVVATFNIRALGSDKVIAPTKSGGRTQGAWDLLARFVSQCDFVAIQEVRDDLSGLIKLKNSLKAADKYALVVSDVTGSRPDGERQHVERLAFLYRWDRIERTELASDLTYDRAVVLKTLHDHRETFASDFKAYDKAMKKYEKKRAEGKKPTKPKFYMSEFITFVRTPHVASFRIRGKAGADPLPFVAINAHLLYGDKSKSVEERKKEFDALVEWLIWRTKSSERMYHRDMILLGDMNLEFEERFTSIDAADTVIKDMNTRVEPGYAVNFPLLSVPDKRRDPPVGDGKGRYLTTARMTQTYDQIGLFAKSGALPDHNANAAAGTHGANGYDYGVFNFADLFAKAVAGSDGFLAMKKAERKKLVARFEYDVSDHLPAWVRLPIPGA